MVISDDNDVVISDDDFDNYPPWSEENQRSVEFHFHVYNTIHAIMIGFLCVPFCISKCGDIRAALYIQVWRHKGSSHGHPLLKSGRIPLMSFHSLIKIT